MCFILEGTGVSYNTISPQTQSGFQTLLATGSSMPSHKHRRWRSGFEADAWLGRRRVQMLESNEQSQDADRGESAHPLTELLER